MKTSDHKQKSNSETPDPESFVVFIGIDWADQKHDLCLLEPGRKKPQRLQLDNTPEALHEWIAQILEQYADRGRIAIALEKFRGALLYTLMSYRQLCLYPLNSKVVGHLAGALRAGGGKNDQWDAELLAEMVRSFHHKLPVWSCDDELTAKLAALCQDRRAAVAGRTKISQKLQALLKAGYPFALELLDGDTQSLLAAQLLKKWPDFSSLQQAGAATVRRWLKAHKYRRMDKVEPVLARLANTRPVTTDPAVIEPARLQLRMLCDQLMALLPYIEEYDRQIAQTLEAHPDSKIFTSVPGAGKALAPRLLCAFGSDRQRFAGATEFSSFVGIAPVTVSSGQSSRQHRRYACSKFLRQSFHEFARASIGFSPWAKAFYQAQRERGKAHHTAVRALAYKWIRILYACWKNQTPYQEELYQQSLQQRGAAWAAKL